MKINGLSLKRLMMLKFVIGCLLAVLIIPITASISHSASSDWKPEKNVEYIVGTSAGSGTDIRARMVQQLLQTKGIVKTSISVVNKPGGGATIALSYLNQHAGDGHYLMGVGSSFLANHITGISPIHYTDVTPLAVLGMSTVVFSVNAEGPIKTGKDLVDRLKKDPNSVSIGIAPSRGNANHIAACLVMREAGGEAKNLKIVIFDAQSKGMMALMGGHVDLVVSGIDAAIQNIQTGKVRAIAIAAEKRWWGEASSIPTWKEQGINAVMGIDFNLVMGPKGMSEAQTAYWDDVFAKMVQSDEWKKFESENFTLLFYKNSKESKKYLEGPYGQLKSILTDLGLAKMK